MSGCTPYISAIWNAGVDVGMPTAIGCRRYPCRSRRCLKNGIRPSASACSSTERESPSIWTIRKRRPSRGGAGPSLNRLIARSRLRCRDRKKSSSDTTDDPIIHFMAARLFAHFPEGVTPRPEQARLLAALERAVEVGDGVVLIEAPPGVGKSHVAMTLARWSGDAYLLTSQKLLQDQYEREFGGSLQLVKGRDNYPCELYPAELRVTTSHGKCRRPRGPQCQCPYVRAKTAALNGPIFCTNTAYFATLRHWHAEQLRRRRLLIIDEAHHLESQLVSVFTVGFPPEQMRAWFGAALPRLASADAYRPLMAEHLERLEGLREVIGRELEALRPPEIAADQFLRMPPARAEQ